ncbi:MAG: DUF4268 domain-containing protein, partial [Flavobacteriaceae bacterium]|nr:DUF4268 domain-containing protein [Flavobacteriaceae bacterium]
FGIEPSTISIVEKSNDKIKKFKDLEAAKVSNKLTFIEASQLCLKNNNNKPMSGNEIWDSIKDLVSYSGETPVATLTARLGKYSENSTHKIKSKIPIFRIVSENPNKYVLIDPNNIQETEIDDIDETDHESEIPTGTEAQYLSFWNEFTRRLSQSTKRFDGRRRNRQYWLKTPTDQKSISYICVIRRYRADLEVYFESKSSIYYKLLKLRDQIEKKFGNSLEWIDSQQKKCCKIIFVKRLDQNFPENKEEVMQFFLDNFPNFERVFDKYLNNPDNIPEEPTDTKISKFSDWTSSYPNVSPQYKYPNPTTKITSEPQKFTSYLTPIDKFLAPNSQKPQTDIERPRIYARNPFRQAICVFGESGAGKSTTVEKILRKEGHQIVKIMPPASTTGLVINFEPSKSRYVPGYFGKLLITASQNPEKLYTAFFDEMHKTSVIDMINDELLQAISLKRNDGVRFVTLDPESSLMFSKTSLLHEESGVIYVPDNVGFIFITSKPKVIANNPDFFNRVDLVKIQGEEDWKRMQTSEDLIDNILSSEEKSTFSSIRND